MSHPAKNNEDVLDKEREFHDEWAATIKPSEVMVRETFTAATSPESAWLFKQMGDLTGKKLLDIGSGGGESAVWFAMHGADVMATDLSPGMCDVVKKVATHYGTSLESSVCNAEDLSQFPDNSFDVIFCANVLHHVDIDKCLGECARVLKSGGQMCSWDPVAHNPVINIYRGMAMEVRTEDEHPIRMQDLEIWEKHFGKVDKEFFWLSSLVLFLKFYLVDKIDPNEDRYWKRILTHEKENNWFYKPLAALDKILLKTPLLKWWAWNIAIVGYKK